MALLSAAPEAARRTWAPTPAPAPAPTAWRAGVGDEPSGRTTGVGPVVVHRAFEPWNPGAPGGRSRARSARRDRARTIRDLAVVARELIDGVDAAPALPVAGQRQRAQAGPVNPSGWRGEGYGEQVQTRGAGALAFPPPTHSLAQWLVLPHVRTPALAGEPRTSGSPPGLAPRAFVLRSGLVCHGPCSRLLRFASIP